MYSVKTLWRYVRRVWVALGLGSSAVFIGWSLLAYRANDDARFASQSDSTVVVHVDDGVWSFTPRLTRAASTPILVFFPGALVSPVAYAPLLRAAASAGFLAYLVELPRRGALGGVDAPALTRRFDRVVADTTAAHHWVIAGHSRGAVVASRFAAEHRTGFAGLVLIGTTHPRDVDLSTLGVAVTKIVGTHDGVAKPADVEANRAKLPASTRWVSITGGNHSQFGWYGFQPGDRRATVAASVQRAAMIQAVLDALTQAGETQVSTQPSFRR